MLTVDLLHEVELGVWKALFTHLMRMLHACGADKVHEFDKQCGLLHGKLKHLSDHVYLGSVFGWSPHSVTKYAALKVTFRK